MNHAWLEALASNFGASLRWSVSSTWSLNGGDFLRRTAKAGVRKRSRKDDQTHEKPDGHRHAGARTLPLSGIRFSAIPDLKSSTPRTQETIRLSLVTRALSSRPQQQSSARPSSA